MRAIGLLSGQLHFVIMRRRLLVIPSANVFAICLVSSIFGFGDTMSLGRSIVTHTDSA